MDTDKKATGEKPPSGHKGLTLVIVLGHPKPGLKRKVMGTRR